MYKIFTKSGIKKLVMRVSFMYLVLLVSGIQMLLASNSKGQGLEDIMITVELNEQNLESLLKNIERQTGLTFAYLPSEVQQYRVISLTPGKHSVKAVLDKALWNTDLRYKFIENSIIIFPKEDNKDRVSSTNETTGEVTNLGEYTKNLPLKKETTVDLLTRKDMLKVFNKRFVFSVSGNVVDEQGEPLIGVNIQVKGTNKGTATDFEGNFSLEDIDENTILVVSYVGYQTQEVAVAGTSNLAITMISDSQLLDEVVVIGYGTVKKSDLTGSVQRINGENFQNQPMTQITDMLTGTVAGFNASQGTSAEGGSSLEIRGPTSLNANTEPLVVLDGAIYNGSLADISPNDIESVDILKDASSAAVFGSRAASGVMIITTKRGASGKPNITFSSSLGLSEVTNKSVRPLNAQEYLDFRRDYQTKQNPDQPEYYYYDPNNLPGGISREDWLNLNSNPNSDYTGEWLNRLTFFPEEVKNYQNGNTIDWFDQTMRTGIRQNYDLSVRGGSEEISYYWSIGHTDNEGIIIGDDFSTIRTRLNVDAKVTNYLNVGVNAQFSKRDDSAIPADLNRMFIGSPYGSMFEEDGSLKWFPNDYAGAQNPLLNTNLQRRSGELSSLFSRIYATLKLPFGIEYKPSFQPRLSNANNYNFWGSDTPTGLDVAGRGTRSESRVFEWMFDNLLTWKTGFGDHAIDMTFLYNLEKYQSWGTNLQGNGFAPNENLSFNALQFASNQTITNSDAYSTGDALMGRINYTYAHKYLVTASIRQDGYSAFGQGNSRAIFPAVALAWKVSEEDFFNNSTLSTLKLRMSWGINGNRDIGRYAALAQLGQNIYYNGSKILVGVYNSTLENPNLAWERTEALNLGVDLGLFQGRVNGSFEIYDMTTRDLLMNRILPTITGFDNITSNLGELKNRGFELTLNSVNIDNRNFAWNSNIMFSLNRNKINSLFGDFEEVVIDGQTVQREVSDISNEWFIGEGIDRIWNYDIIGVWQTNEKDEAAKYGQAPGDYKAVDVNNDGVYSQLDDKQFIGWENPRYRIGFRNEFQFYKNLTLSIFLRSELGHKGSIPEFEHLQGNLYDREGMRNIPYWTAANPSNEYASLITSSAAFGGGYNRYFDRSFLRVQDLSLSHNLPKDLLEKINIQNFRVYSSIRNLYSIDQWPDWDPESNNSPMPRTYSLGIELTL